MSSIILVHGAWCDGSSWSRVVPLLQDAGHDVIAVQLPLTSLDADVALTRKAIGAAAGPVVLAGHSYGGAVITAAAEAPAVSALVYVAAYAPDAGESVQGLGERFDATPGVGAIRADDEGFLTLDRSLFAEVFAQDLDPAEARVLAAVEKPTHASCFGAPLGGAPAWRSIPSTYVRSAHDRMVSPDLEAFLAERMGATTTSLESGHASPVSRPAEVAAAILQAA